MLRFPAAAALALALAAPAGAQSGASLTFGFGAKLQPAYPGSADQVTGASGFVRLHALKFGGVGVGDPTGKAQKLGWGLRGAFAMTPERKAADHAELAGLKDVKRGVELGLGLGYEAETWRLFVDLRKGVHGHYGTVAVLGGDAKLQATPALSLSLGPRAVFATDGYVDTYFQVSAAESALSGLAVHDPSGGLVATGVEFRANYDFGNDWGIEGKATWNWLQGDAKDSPITQAGSAGQGSVSVLLTRRISFGF